MKLGLFVSIVVLPFSSTILPHQNSISSTSSSREFNKRLNVSCELLTSEMSEVDSMSSITLPGSSFSSFNGIQSAYSTNSSLYQNLILKQPKYKRVSEAYGFLLGQEYVSERIKKEFPEYAVSITKAELKFNSTFGNAKTEMHKYLVATLGDEEFEIYIREARGKMKELLSKQYFSEESVDKFIKDVEERSIGKIYSPVLETLLSMQYTNRPHEEFLSGFTQTFKTKGHPKAKNTDWQIKIPRSWKGTEGERPNIIQKFTSDYGDGDQSIMLMVQELDGYEDIVITREDLEEFFSYNNMIEIIPEGAKQIAYKKITIDNNIGGALEYEFVRERLDIKVKIRVIQYLFINKGQLYIIQGMIGSTDINKDFNTDMKKHLPLFSLVANSIVVHSQYR